MNGTPCISTYICFELLQFFAEMETFKIDRNCPITLFSIMIVTFFQCCSDREMNPPSQKSAFPPNENGIHHDKIIILDAGSQYGKVNLLLFYNPKRIFKSLITFTGYWQEDSRITDWVTHPSIKYSCYKLERFWISWNNNIWRPELHIRRWCTLLWFRYFQNRFTNFR